MISRLILTLLILAGTGLAVEPIDRMPLRVPEGAMQIDVARISIPLAHKARSAELLFKSKAGKIGFCVLRPDQARNLAGPQYKKVEGLKPILVKWSFIEPANEKSLDKVTSHTPSIYIKNDVLYVSSSGIDIGDVGKVVESVLVVQVETLPNKVTGKLSRIGW